MNAKIQKVFQIILGLSLVGGIVYGAWLLLNAFVAAVTAASPEVVAAIVGAMATVLVGISAVLISQAHERKRSSEEAHRLKKVEIYQSFIDMISRMIGSSNQNLALKQPDTQELVHYLFKFKADILLWGSPKVIKAQIEFENVSESGDTKKLFMSVNALYLAIREDIGLSNSGLNKMELVKLYLNNDARKELS
ncbi:hypothetical protein [Methylophilus sp. Leaf414]|uniref:hypothetical protein n=1 Tax=Methylophilus sp. Leaf414 TaxID=1736371 RepID=UPI0006F9842B|nr:hypothetical protein [Methylophilus sp. Leaf414]KQT33279.1 hypothetical protein ASG24_13395 [Methylophilus sp. Leaf414]